MSTDTGDATTGVEVRLLQDGPILVKGQLTIQLPDGTTIDKSNAALCRCGGSGNKPFCDGSHRANGFKG